MSWDPTWEQVFRARGWSRYPSEQVIRFVARHFYGTRRREQTRILELGCAEGNNLWYLAREGFSAFGIDGSKTAIANANKRLRADGLSADLQVGDVSYLRDLYQTVHFDAIIDAGCLTCNRIEVVRSILDQITDCLKPSGKLFSMMLASGSYGEELGDTVELRTVTNIRSGGLKGLGVVRFFTLQEIEELFSDFSNVEIDFVIRGTENQQQQYKHWLITADVP